MLDQILVVVSLSLLIVISPGPDMVIVMRNTLVGGRAAGLTTSAGILVGNLVHIGYCAVGIGWLISQSIVAFTVLRYAAAAYLIYLGVMSLREAGRSVDLDTARAEVAGRTWFAQGLINNILNPKGALFFLGVFTMVITPDTSIAVVTLLVVIMLSIFAGFWLIFVHTLDTRIVRRALENFQRAVKRVFGGLLIFLGLRVAAMER